MRRTLLSAVALAVLVPGIAGAAGGTRITGVDTGAYPAIRVTVVTPQPTAKPPKLTQDGEPVIGFAAKNLGREKSVAMVFDRSQSMQGQAMKDATAAARAFVRSKPASDRVAVVAVGKQAFQLTGFSPAASEADAACAPSKSTRYRAPRSSTLSSSRHGCSTTRCLRHGFSCS